jgi:hypothetical protein
MTYETKRRIAKQKIMVNTGERHKATTTKNSKHGKKHDETHPSSIPKIQISFELSFSSRLYFCCWNW